MRTRCGYTLIEVLVVVVIVGIAAGIVVPSLIRPGQLTIQAAARMLMADLILTQNEAVAQGATRRLHFDLASQSYRMTDAADNVVTLPWEKQGYKISLTGDGRFDGVVMKTADFNSSSWIGFDEMGAPTSAGTIEIVHGEYKYRISIRAFTGRVTVAPF